MEKALRKPQSAWRTRHYSGEITTLLKSPQPSAPGHCQKWDPAAFPVPGPPRPAWVSPSNRSSWAAPPKEILISLARFCYF